MSVARRRARAKKEATRRADMLPTYPCEGSTLPRDRLRSERPPAAVLECGEQPRAGGFMLEARARSVLMIEPSAGLIFTPTRLAYAVLALCATDEPLPKPILWCCVWSPALD